MAETLYIFPEAILYNPNHPITKVQLVTKPLAKNGRKVADRLFDHVRNDISDDILSGDRAVANRRWGEWAGYTIITQELDQGVMLDLIRNLPYQVDLGYLRGRFMMLDPNDEQAWIRLANALGVEETIPRILDRLVLHILDRYGSEIQRGDRVDGFFREPPISEESAGNHRIIGPRFLCITNPDDSEEINRLLQAGVNPQRDKSFMPAAAPDGYIIETYEVEETSYWGPPQRFRRVRLIGAIEYSLTGMQITSKVAKLTRFVNQLTDSSAHWQTKSQQLFQKILLDHFGIEEQAIPQLPQQITFVFMGLGGTAVEDIDDSTIFSGAETRNDHGVINVLIGGAKYLELDEKTRRRIINE